MSHFKKRHVLAHEVMPGDQFVWDNDDVALVIAKQNSLEKRTGRDTLRIAFITVTKERFWFYNFEFYPTELFGYSAITFR